MRFASILIVSFALLVTGCMDQAAGPVGFLTRAEFREDSNHYLVENKKGLAELKSDLSTEMTAVKKEVSDVKTEIASLKTDVGDVKTEMGKFEKRAAEHVTAEHDMTRSKIVTVSNDILGRLTTQDAELKKIYNSVVGSGGSAGGGSTGGGLVTNRASGSPYTGSFDIRANVDGVKYVMTGSGSPEAAQRVLKEARAEQRQRGEQARQRRDEAELIRLRTLKELQDKQSSSTLRVFGDRVTSGEQRVSAMERELPEQLSQIEAELREHGEGIAGITARTALFHKRIEQWAAQHAARVVYGQPTGVPQGQVYRCQGWDVCPNPARRVIHAWARR